MQFGEKYELLEPVTIGRVMSFMARDRFTHAPVVVHMFEYDDRTSESSGATSILQSFRRIAPAPVGNVLTTGRCEDSPYAYITIEAPDPVALREWTRVYRLLGQTTGELNHESQTSSAQDGKDTTADFGPPPGLLPSFEPLSSRMQPPANERASTDARSPERSRELGEFPNAFGRLEPMPPGRPAESESPRDGAPAPPRQPDPGAFTKQFLSAGEASYSPRQERPGADPLLRPPFEKGSAEDPPSREVVEASQSDSFKDTHAGTGEFTRFFRDPFDRSPGNDNTLSPILSGLNAGDIETQRQQVGEFTRLFGKLNVKDEAQDRSLTPPPAPAASTDPEPGNFTRIFGALQVPLAVPSIPKPSSEIAGSSSKDPAVPSPGVGTVNPAGAKSGEPPGFGPLYEQPVQTPRQTTHTFAEATPVRSTGDTTLTLGPSEYTRIISPPKSQEPTHDPVQDPPPGAAKAPIPVPIALPGLNLQAPRMASVAPPPVPHFQAPNLQVQKLPTPSPQPQQAPAPPRSYLPLVLIFNLLLVLAIALVLYFALKH